MESSLYGIYALVVFVSEILLVRFLIRQQLVRKYRTPALSMKYSLYIGHQMFTNLALFILTFVNFLNLWFQPQNSRFEVRDRSSRTS